MLLSLGRVLITQNNEEIMLTRLSQIGITKQDPFGLISTIDDATEAHQGTVDNEPADFYAKFFLHAINVAVNGVARYCYSTVCDQSCLITLKKLTQRLLIMFATMLSSGEFRNGSIFYEIFSFKLI